MPWSVNHWLMPLMVVLDVVDICNLLSGCRCSGAARVRTALAVSVQIRSLGRAMIPLAYFSSECFEHRRTSDGSVWRLRQIPFHVQADPTISYPQTPCHTPRPPPGGPRRLRDRAGGLLRRRVR